MRPQFRQLKLNIVRGYWKRYMQIKVNEMLPPVALPCQLKKILLQLQAGTKAEINLSEHRASTRLFSVAVLQTKWGLVKINCFCSFLPGLLPGMTSSTKRVVSVTTARTKSSNLRSNIPGGGVGFIREMQFVNLWSFYVSYRYVVCC